MHDHEKLVVWQKSMDLVESIYQLTKIFPKEEQYGLTSQMRRAAVSIPSNIAEGSKRKTDKDFAQFLTIALGSNSELDTQLKIALRLEYVREVAVTDTMSLIDEISRMIYTLIKRLK